MNLDRDITPGLYQKFNVERTDEASRSRHPDCSYFVLDLTHDPHARPALVAYIHSCRYAFPELAADLSALLDRLEPSPPRCHGTTTRGARCRNLTYATNGCCYVHRQAAVTLPAPVVGEREEKP